MSNTADEDRAWYCRRPQHAAIQVQFEHGIICVVDLDGDRTIHSDLPWVVQAVRSTSLRPDRNPMIFLDRAGDWHQVMIAGTFIGARRLCENRVVAKILAGCNPMLPQGRG